MNRGSKKDAVPAFASRVASSSQTLPTMTLSHAVAAYGVGAGDSAGDGEGISTEPSVFGGFLFAALCRFGDGVGVALAAAGAVVVAVVPCCVQEAIHAMPMMAPSKHNTYLFIGCWFQFEPRRMFGCIKSSKRASNENFKRGYLPNQGALQLFFFSNTSSPILTPQKCERFALAMFHLIHRALTRVFVGSPTQEFCAVPKSAASKMVIGHFHYHSWIDGFPFAGSVRAPTARSSRRAASETR